MGVIVVKYDHSLEQSDIEVSLAAPDDDGEITNRSGVSQTDIHGVLTPIVSVSGMVFDWNQVMKMTLYNDSRLPRIDLVIDDGQKLLSTVNNQINDNEVRLQILPPFEDTYKKINLTFYIDTIEVDGTKVFITATYKVADLYKSRLKSFGEINSYNLFDSIASECKLGFATNCEASDVDTKFVYCDNISYEKLMEREIKMTGNQDQIFDFWIDYWNNINFVDMTARYRDKDSEEDLEVWVYNKTGQQVDSFEKQEPIKQDAIITNHPSFAGDLFTKKYKIVNNTGVNQRKGTDKVHTIYKDGSIIDILIEDGNPHNDLFTKYSYLGENIGEYEYLSSKSYHESFLDIVNKNNIEVVLESPNLGLTRGSHVKFDWWANSYFEKDNINKLGGDMEDESGDQTDELNSEFNLIKNKQISGEYLILKTVLRYNNGKWLNTLTLTRPTEEIKSYTNNE